MRLFFLRALFTARLIAARTPACVPVCPLRRPVARPQVATHRAAIGASAQRGATFFCARHDDVKKVSSECVVLSAIVHLSLFSSFQMKVKILKSH